MLWVFWGRTQRKNIENAISGGRWESVRDYYKEIKAKIESPDLITGHDLIALGMKPGPEIGKILAQVRDARDSGKSPTVKMQ